MKTPILITLILTIINALALGNPNNNSIVKPADTTRELYYSRIAKTFPDGKMRDKITIMYAGNEMGAIVECGAKVAFIINNNLYEEKEFKKLLKKHKNILPDYPSSENKTTTFKISNYASVFNFWYYLREYKVMN